MGNGLLVALACAIVILLFAAIWRHNSRFTAWCVKGVIVLSVGALIVVGYQTVDRQQSDDRAAVKLWLTSNFRLKVTRVHSNSGSDSWSVFVQKEYDPLCTSTLVVTRSRLTGGLPEFSISKLTPLPECYTLNR